MRGYILAPARLHVSTTHEYNDYDETEAEHNDDI
jgi:hypothetical protein